MKATALALFLFAIAGCSHPLGVALPPARANAAPLIRVDRVIDGDTFVAGGHKIRVLVMDACELNTPGGKRARGDAQGLLAGGVRLTAEPGHDKDLYGRDLRYVQLPDGRDFATVMLARDHTAVYTGRSAASTARTAQGRTADRDGRRCSR